MNSPNLGGLASDQKIQNIFHAFGYSIPVGKDGRRLWPTKFKRAMGQRMRSGELSIGEVQKTCQVSNKTAYSWRKGSSRKPSPKQQKTPKPARRLPKSKSSAMSRLNRLKHPRLYLSAPDVKFCCPPTTQSINWLN